MKSFKTVILIFTLLLTACTGSDSGDDGGGTTSPSTTPSAVTLDSIDVTAVNTTVPAGLSESFNATGNYSDGHSEDITASVSWRSTDETLATVDENGLMTALTAGNADIEASMDGVTGTASVTISSAVLDRITLDPTDPELAIGLSRRFAATGHYSDGRALTMTGLTWDSSDETVAMINNKGRVIAVSPGATSISASDGTVIGQTSLTVPAKQLVDITVTAIDGATEIPVGTTEQYIATGIYDDGSSDDISNDVSWTSSDTSVVTISGALATGIVPGNVTISAGKDSITSAGVALTVTAATLESINITPTSTRLLVGSTKQYQALGNFSDGTQKEITSFAQTKWTSDDTTVARVTKGRVTGRGAGTAEITVTNRGIDAKFQVNVADVNSASVKSIELSPDNAFIRYDHSQKYTVTAILFASGPFGTPLTQDVTEQAGLIFSTNGIASVSQDGTVTGVGIGNTSLTASYAGRTAQVTLHGIGKSPVLQTGQTTCYDSNNDPIGCARTGQDGNYQSGLKLANRWEVDGDCVIDHLTGLLWIKPNLLNSDTPWLDELHQVKTVNRCGYGIVYDWHIPNWNEMRSLINYGQANPGSYLAAQGFDGADVSRVWTSTTDHYSGESNAIFMSMTDGDDDIAPKLEPEKFWAVRELNGGDGTLPETGQQRCWDVTGNPINCFSTDGKGQDADVKSGVTWPQPRFIRDGECMTDLLTGLTWVRIPDNTVRDWHEALTFSTSTSYCGQDGWRLPNINELQSLIHQGYPEGAGDVTTYLALEGFGVVPKVVYWSSTTYAGDPSKAWVVDMHGSGDTYKQDKVNPGIGRTWLVRGRKTFE